MIKVIFIYYDGSVVEMEFSDLDAILSYTKENISRENIKSILILK